MRTLRVVNPEATNNPKFQAMAKKAMESSLGQYDTIPPEWITDPNKAIFIAYEGGELQGLGVLFVGIDPPQAVTIYAENVKAKQALIGTGVDFLKDKGYNRFWAANATGRPDSVWKRSLLRKNPMKKLGTIVEFEI